MTSQSETTDFDTNLVDLLQKEFSEEKKAHGETTLRLLSAQAHAQTAEAQAAKAQELVAETTLKLDQAREEIRGLRDQAQEAQVQAHEAQAKIKDLEAQMAQMKVVERSQAAIEAQAQELETAQAKIASLEARMVKARAFFAELDVETNFESEDAARELKAAEAKNENLEAQMAQMKVVEQFQTQAQELSAAHAKIIELEAQMAQSEKQAEEEVLLLNTEIRDLKAQTQELQEAQAKIKDLEAQVPKPPAPTIMSEKYTQYRQYPNQWFCIVQNDVRLYFKNEVMKRCQVFTKFIPKQNATLELSPGFQLIHSRRVRVSDGKDWKYIGHIGPDNEKLPIGSLVWSWVTKRTPARINALGKEEYQLAICVDL